MKTAGSRSALTGLASRNGASTSPSGTGTASRSITASATRTGARETTASVRPRSRRAVTCLVPYGPPSSILAVQVCSVTSSMSARSGWISTPVTLPPAALISLTASSSGMPCVVQMSSPGRSSSAGSGVPSGSRASQARSARCPASSASTTSNPSSRATTGTRGSLRGPVSAGLPGPGSACAMRTVITNGPGRDKCCSHSLVSVGHQAVTGTADFGGEGAGVGPRPPSHRCFPRTSSPVMVGMYVPGDSLRSGTW
jgi:hypothetical protein